MADEHLIMLMKQRHWCAECRQAWSQSPAPAHLNNLVSLTGA